MDSMPLRQMTELHLQQLLSGLVDVQFVHARARNERHIFLYISQR